MMIDTVYRIAHNYALSLQEREEFFHGIFQNTSAKYFFKKLQDLIFFAGRS
jgi:hypothetical protein